MSTSKKTLGLRLTKRKRTSVEDRETEPANPSTESTSSPSEDITHTRKKKKEEIYQFAEPGTSSGDSGYESSRFLVPGYNYLGPFNPLDNGPPTNAVDQIAREHDLRYSQAQEVFAFTGNKEQAVQSISEADDNFIEDLSQVEPGSYTEAFGKFIGLAGIKSKRAVEGFLQSTLYPNFTEMDVVDGGEATTTNMSFTPDNLFNPIMNMGTSSFKANSTNWNFSKNFNLAFESHCLSYNKTTASDKLAHGETNIYTFIHSLPWEKLYFYLTEREYNTITNSFHTAYVDCVKIKIFNMGVNNPVLQTKSTVEYKVTNSNNYFSVFRGFEKHGPCILGKSITPEILYGKSLVNLTDSSTKKAIPIASIGAISEQKTVDNRVVYNKITSKFVDNKKVDVPEAQIFLPPLMDMSIITLNANTSIGLVYETMYRPKDGIFHNKSYSFHNSAVVQHKPYEQNIDLADNGKITDAEYVITDTAKQNSPIISYQNATIDNMFFRSIGSNRPLQFVDGLGVGLLPKRDKNGTNVDASLELSIHTEIKIRAEAFGALLKL